MKAARNNPAPSPEAMFSDAFKKLEPKICDLHNMAHIAWGEVEGAIGQTEGLTEQQLHQYETATFAVSHVLDLAGDLKRDYYAAFEAEKETARPTSRPHDRGTKQAPASVAADLSSGLIDTVDRLDEEARFVNGIFSAVEGLEVLNEKAREGVVELVGAHRARLKAIRNEVDQLRGQ